MEIKKVGVVGCGLMGSGIAEVCARSGYDVIVAEVNQEFLDSGMKRLNASLDKAVKRGKMEAQAREDIAGRLKGTIKLEDFKDRDLVIEAVIENLDEKKRVFTELDKYCPPHAFLASNTSCLSILDIATATKRPSQVMGMHFFSPVPVMNLVEIIRTIVTSDEAIGVAKDFAASINKKAIYAKDTPGFIVNLLLAPFLNNAVRALESGVATKEDIDQGAVLGLNHPMGPLTLMDFIGLDTLYYISCSMYDEFKDPMFAPPILLKKMVTAGHLGRKSGKGFYDYTL